MEEHGIGWAVKQMMNGLKVYRGHWNGKGMYIRLSGDPAPMSLPYVFMKTSNGDFIPWVCSQSDLLATDWDAVED